MPPQVTAASRRQPEVISECGIDGHASPAGLVCSLAQTVLTSGTSLARFVRSSMQSCKGPPNADQSEGPPDASYVIPADVVSALQDDLNTPLALAGIHAAADAVFAADTPEQVLRTTGALKAAGRLLGLLQADPGVWFQGDGDAAIDALIAERLEARAAKDFERADQIRDDLAARGIVLEDGAGGTTWRREG